MRILVDDEYLTIVSSDNRDGFSIARILETVDGLMIEDYCAGGFDCDPGEGWRKSYDSMKELTADREWLEGEDWDRCFAGGIYNGVPVGISFYPHGSSIEIFWSMKRNLPGLVDAMLEAFDQAEG